jgi:hypothetical protein
MKNIFIFLLTFLTGVCSLKCNHGPSQGKTGNNSDSARVQIQNLLLVHENAVIENNAHGRKVIKEMCMDSLLYEGTDGIIRKVSSEFFSNDQVAGYIERPHDKVIEIYGNTALASFASKGYWVFAVDTLYYDSRSTRIFIWFMDKWKLAYVGFTQLAVNYTKEVKSNQQTQNDYIGIYRRDSLNSDTVVLIKNALCTKTTGESTYDTLIPINDSSYIFKNVLGQIIFNKSSAGKVISYTFVLIDGQRIRAPKIK